jgi:hypothetical protein
MKIHTSLLTVLLFLTGTLLLASNTTTTWLFHDDGSEETGSASKTLKCTIERSGDQVDLAILSLWQPGASVEIHGRATANDVQIVPGPNGSSIEEINFQFEDSFGNRGTGRCSIIGSTSTLLLSVTSPHADSARSRVTRQYADDPFELRAISN